MICLDEPGIGGIRMPDIKEAIEVIKAQILTVVPDTEAIYLFGSHAYGTPHKDSDIDIFVIVPDCAQKNPVEIAIDIRGSIPQGFGYPLDILVGKSASFSKRRKGPTLQRTIAQKGVKLYER
jgi:predicted nucleotidyltransferase